MANFEQAMKWLVSDNGKIRRKSWLDGEYIELGSFTNGQWSLNDHRKHNRYSESNVFSATEIMADDWEQYTRWEEMTNKEIVFFLGVDEHSNNLMGTGIFWKIRRPDIHSCDGYKIENGKLYKKVTG